MNHAAHTLQMGGNDRGAARLLPSVAWRRQARGLLSFSPSLPPNHFHEKAVTCMEHSHG